MRGHGCPEATSSIGFRSLQWQHAAHTESTCGTLDFSHATLIERRHLSAYPLARLPANGPHNSRTGPPTSEQDTMLWQSNFHHPAPGHMTVMLADVQSLIQRL